MCLLLYENNGLDGIPRHQRISSRGGFCVSRGTKTRLVACRFPWDTVSRLISLSKTTESLANSPIISFSAVSNCIWRVHRFQWAYQSGNCETPYPCPCGTDAGTATRSNPVFRYLAELSVFVPLHSESIRATSPGCRWLALVATTA